MINCSGDGSGTIVRHIEGLQIVRREEGHPSTTVALPGVTAPVVCMNTYKET